MWSAGPQHQNMQEPGNGQVVSFMKGGGCDDNLTVAVIVVLSMSMSSALEMTTISCLGFTVLYTKNPVKH